VEKCTIGPERGACVGQAHLQRSLPSQPAQTLQTTPAGRDAAAVLPAQQRHALRPLAEVHQPQQVVVGVALPVADRPTQRERGRLEGDAVEAAVPGTARGRVMAAPEQWRRGPFCAFDGDEGGPQGRRICTPQTQERQRCRRLSRLRVCRYSEGASQTKRALVRPLECTPFRWPQESDQMGMGRVLKCLTESHLAFGSQ
jgi:hypothetical protein